MKIDTMLCIPGNWRDRDDFILSVASRSNLTLIAGGNIILEVGTGKSVEFEFESRIDTLGTSFRYAGSVNRVSDEFIQRIDEHTSVVYLKIHGGSFETLRVISEMALRILDVGGFGVLVESAGIAFEPTQWQSLAGKDSLADFIPMFVVQSIENESAKLIYTCGMHNLGFPDASVANEELQFSVQLLRVFNYYQVIDKPVLHHNQTFSIDLESPRFRVQFSMQVKDDSNGLFWNPFGMWNLTRV